MHFYTKTVVNYLLPTVHLVAFTVLILIGVVANLLQCVVLHYLTSN